MSWMKNWKRPSDMLSLSLGYGETNPTATVSVSTTSPINTDSKAVASQLPDPTEACKYRVAVEWPVGEEDEQVALRLQSQLMVTLPPPHDVVQVRIRKNPPKMLPKAFSFKPGFVWPQNDQAAAKELPDSPKQEDKDKVFVQMKVVKFREPLRVVCLSRSQPGGGSGSDGLSMLTRVLGPGSSEKIPSNANPTSVTEELLGYTQHWRSLTILSLAGCGISSLPPEISRLPMLEMLFLDYNRISGLPAELGQLSRLKVLKADQNQITTVPIELRQCEKLEELSLEFNKLVRPLLDFRSLVHLRVLRLFGNPLEFFPEILPCAQLRQLSLANVRIESDQNLSSVQVTVSAADAPSTYFGAKDNKSKHSLSAFFALIFRYSSVHHPLLASALAKMCQEPEYRSAIGRDTSALRQIISMLLSDSHHVLEQACHALSSLAEDPEVVPYLMGGGGGLGGASGGSPRSGEDVLQAIGRLLQSDVTEILVPVLRFVASLAFSSDDISSQLLSRDTVDILHDLGANHSSISVQKEALNALGSFAFCLENRRLLLATQGLRSTLLLLAEGGGNSGRKLRKPGKNTSRKNSDKWFDLPVALAVRRAATRTLAILGENEYLRQAVKGPKVPSRGIRVLAMDGGGMRGMSTVQMLREVERVMGKRVQDCFDLICGTSTGGLLAVALGVMGMDLSHCEEVYKKLGKQVFENVDNSETASWREKLDSLYKSSSQNLRVMVHGSKHSAEEFERLLKQLLVHEDLEGDLLIDASIKPGPKVFVVSTLVSVSPAVPFIFRTYQYPPGTPEVPLWPTEGADSTGPGSGTTGDPGYQQPAPKKAGYVGSCKFHTWEAVRASSAAPYYLDDFTTGSCKFEDGAILANNPSIVAVREARLLWPDSPLNCLVSVGCGQVPARPRGRGGWRLADTGQVLVEAACSVERSEEIMETFLPLIPDMHYFRFQPTDERCGMELDETDPAQWKKLEAATEDYVHSNRARFEMLRDCLGDPDQAETEGTRQGTNGGSQRVPRAEPEPSFALLGFRRSVLVVDGVRVARSPGHGRDLQRVLHSKGIKCDRLDCSAVPPAGAGQVPGVPAEPWQAESLSNGARSDQSESKTPQQANSVPQSPSFRSLSRKLGTSPQLDLSSVSNSDFDSSPASRELPEDSSAGSKGRPVVPARLQSRSSAPPLSACSESILTRSQHSEKMGIVHLALPCDPEGFILSWREDVHSVAEPSQSADLFLAECVAGLLSSRHSAVRSAARQVHSLLQLITILPVFSVGSVKYQFAGRYSQVLSDGVEAAVYLFKRTVPNERITARDALWMAGLWRERVVICSGLYSPPASVLSSILDCGAKVVICPSQEPPLPVQKAEESEEREGAMEEGEGQQVASLSGHEESLLEEEEEAMVAFLSKLFDEIFVEGNDPTSAVGKALEESPNVSFACRYQHEVEE